MSKISRTPEPPYFAVVFTNRRTSTDDKGYQNMAVRMNELALQQPGCLGYESARDENGFGITVSCWRDEASIKAWQQQGEHLDAQRLGREKWYKNFSLRVSRVERACEFGKQDQ